MTRFLFVDLTAHRFARAVKSTAALALVLTLAACGATRESVPVTQRPDLSTTTPAPVPPPRPDVVLTPFPSGYDTVRTQRFDGGKMWTFDNPPLDYFAEAYDFRPDDAWFERARLAALRLPNCSASFVSARGLVMTNHHCARDAIVEVTRSGETLLDDGFYAATLEEERRVDELYVDQLVALRDVTRDVYDELDEGETNDQQSEAREAIAERLEARLTREAKADGDTTLLVQVIPLYEGGQYSAYTFKRYHDVRLVMAPELRLGYFGGDADNFTYPRYNLDMAFLRVYDENGAPYEPQYFFPFDPTGAEPGEAVFVVGNPGSTSRLATVSQLEFERDVTLPQQLAVTTTRSRLLKDFIDAHPELAEEYELRPTYLTLRNEVKRVDGQLGGLRDPYLIARRAAAERDLRVAVAADAELEAEYGRVLRELADTQRLKRGTIQQSAAFTYFGVPIASSHILTRGLYGFILDFYRRGNAPADAIADVKKDALEVESWPAALEKAFITARIEEVRDALGAEHPVVKRILSLGTPEAVADSIVTRSALADSAGAARLYDDGFLGSDDAAVDLMQAIAPLYFQLSQQMGNFGTRESNLSAKLGRAQFAVAGTAVPPDASFSLRIADGVVRGYPYNGTVAPPFTTFFGLYERYQTHGPGSDWDLPARWLDAPDTFERGTEYNLVSTNDITGGNSGSPLIDRTHRIVGLVFDSNAQGLPNQYVYRSDQGRSVSVDVRGMIEALRSVYGADRIVTELLNAE